MDRAPNDLREKVRERRRERGWTQEDMANRAGISVRAYQNFETGHGRPQTANLQAILRAAELEADGLGVEGAATREGWRPAIKVYLDTLGAYLETMTDEELDEYIVTSVREIFQRRRSP